MQKVSEAWKEAHRQTLLPETFVEITLHAIDVGIRSIATASGVNESTFSNTQDIVNKMSIVSAERYALLEHNHWVLNGTQEIAPDAESVTGSGYVSGDAVSAGVVVSLSEVREEAIPGFTITWSSQYDEYATDFSIEVKNGGTVVASTTVGNNTSLVSDIPLEVSDYDSVEITVLGWSQPDVRRRIDSVRFGRVVIFDKKDIMTYTHEQSGDLTSTELPKSSIEFTIDNTDGTWNLLNPKGFEKYLYERQPVTVRYGMNLNGTIEWINGGKFYLTEWRVPSNGIEAHFAARDVLAFMLDAECVYVGMRMTVHSTSVFHKDPSYDSDQISNPPAAGTVWDVQETYTENEIEWLRTEKGWTPWLHETVKISTYEELLTELMSQCDLPSDFTVTYPERWDYGFGITHLTVGSVYGKATVAEVLQMCANADHSIIYQTRDGVLTVEYFDPKNELYRIPSFLAYSHPEIELTKPIKRVEIVVHSQESQTKIVEIGKSGDVIVVDNPMILTSLDSLPLQNYYRGSHKYRETVTGEFRADPRLDVFDVVEVESKYGVITPVVLTEITYTYNGSFRGTYKGRRYADEYLS